MQLNIKRLKNSILYLFAYKILLKLLRLNEEHARIMNGFWDNKSKSGEENNGKQEFEI